MSSKYLPWVDAEQLKQVLAAENDEALFSLLAEPLHEELYRRQDFSFLDDLSDAQQLLLSYDYVRSQVGQGGFIQLLVNGYVGLLPHMPRWLDVIGASEMAQLIDDVLKVYVLNNEHFRQDLSNEEFAGLYAELGEFELLDERFNNLNEATVQKILQYAKHHLNEFVEQL